MQSLQYPKRFMRVSAKPGFESKLLLSLQSFHLDLSESVTLIWYLHSSNILFNSVSLILIGVKTLLLANVLHLHMTMLALIADEQFLFYAFL